jgi:hypothetical protein
MQWTVYVLLRVHFFLFINLCSGIVGTDEVRPADMLGCEVSSTQFGECYVLQS